MELEGVPEERPSRAIWWVVGTLIALLVGARFLPEVENPFEIEPVAASVALLPEGESVASDGEHRLDAGRSFRLFAVLEAKDWRDRTVFLSEAPALRLAGRDVAPESLRPYEGGKHAKVRWFTVEPFAPYLEIATAADLERFRLNDNFHPEWGEGWSVAGVVDPKLAFVDPASPLRPLPFGTQRYAVRIERFDDPQAPLPATRTSSPGPEATLVGERSATAVVATAEGRLGSLSVAFGRTLIEPADAAASELRARLGELEQREFAFDRVRLLAAHVTAAGAAPERLVWREVTIPSPELTWGAAVREGDLLQVGARTAALFRDEGESGRLDPADLVFDLGKGLRIRRIDQVFGGEAAIEVELATLDSGRPTGERTP